MKHVLPPVEPITDGQPLFSMRHPQLTPWYKRLWLMIFRPRLSKESVEPVNGMIAYTTSNLLYPDPSEVEGRIHINYFLYGTIFTIIAIIAGVIVFVIL